MPEFINGQEFLYANLLKTGQTTSYVTGDDGDLEKGVSKIYEVKTTGQFSGTTLIKLAHYTSGAGAITFSDALDTIVDTGNGLAIFKTNDVIYTDTPNNLGPFTVTTGNVAGTITCVGATFTSETPVGAVTFYKAENHSNACVVDLRSDPRIGRRMWSQTVSGKMGPASDGKMPWTGVEYDIFDYCAAANTALLGGYGDWRVPNIAELYSIFIYIVGGLPDATAFPSFPAASEVWSSTTNLSYDITYAQIVTSGNLTITHRLKTSATPFLLLVRGG